MNTSVLNLLRYKPTKLSPWLIWGTAECFSLFQFLIQLSGGIIVQPLMKDFSLSATSAAFLISSFYYVYISLQIPVGIITDKVGPRRLLFWGALACGVGCMTFACSSVFFVAFLARLSMGGGAAFAFVGMLYLVNEWFPVSRYAFMVGLSEALGMLWSLIGTILSAILLHAYGWRSFMFGMGVVLLCISLASFLFIRDHNPTRKSIKLGQGITVTLTQRLMIVMRSSVAWINSLYIGLMFSVVTVFVALWGTPFFQLALGVSLTTAAAVGTAAYVGIACGCPFFGMIAQRFEKKRPFLIFSGISAVICFSLVVYLPGLSVFTTTVLMFLMGFLSSGYILSFAIADDIAPAKLKGTFVGFTNAICTGTAPLLQPIIGYILDCGVKRHGVYSLQDYRSALSIMVFSLVFAVFLAWVLPETTRRRPG